MIAVIYYLSNVWVYVSQYAHGLQTRCHLQIHIRVLFAFLLLLQLEDKPIDTIRIKQLVMIKW